MDTSRDLQAISEICDKLNDMEPEAARRVLQFCISEQEERFRKLAQPSNHRPRVPNEVVAR